jgi:hypothetical protein
MSKKSSIQQLLSAPTAKVIKPKPVRMPHPAFMAEVKTLIKPAKADAQLTFAAEAWPKAMIWTEDPNNMYLKQCPVLEQGMYRLFNIIYEFIILEARQMPQHYCIMVGKKPGDADKIAEMVRSFLSLDLSPYSALDQLYRFVQAYEPADTASMTLYDSNISIILTKTIENAKGYSFTTLSHLMAGVVERFIKAVLRMAVNTLVVTGAQSFKCKDLLAALVNIGCNVDFVQVLAEAIKPVKKEAVAEEASIEAVNGKEEVVDEEAVNTLDEAEEVVEDTQIDDTIEDIEDYDGEEYDGEVVK